ncbi:MAG: hypothetical protein RXR01_09770 [Thermoproteus sp.]
MSRRSAALLLVAALLLLADAVGQTLPWIQSNVYQIYAQNVTVAGATRRAFVWVPYFTPPPPPPGWAQVCYIALPTSPSALGSPIHMSPSLVAALTYNSTTQQQYGLPPLLMSDAWQQYNTVTGEYHSELVQNTAHCSMLRYLQLVYNGTSMGGATVALNITTTGVLAGAQAAGPSPSSMSSPTSVSACGVSFTGFNILQPGTYYVKLPLGGYVYLVAPNCTMYILAAEYGSYYWNSSYATWYNGTKYGVAFAVTFSAPCVTYPTVYIGSGINGYLQYGTHVTYCGSQQITLSTSSYYAYYALLAKNSSTAWYRVNFHGGYYPPNIVVPVPVAVNMTTWSGVRLAYASYNNIYWISPGQDFAAERQPEVTFNTTLLQQQPGLLIPQDGGTQQGPSSFLDVFLVDPNNNSNIGLAAFSTYFLPNRVGSAYVMTDGGAAVFPFLGMLRPLVVYAPAGANVLLFIQMSGSTYFTETVACPYPLYTMPGQYYLPPGAVSLINASDINSYSFVQIQNNASTPIYIYIEYTINSVYAPQMYIRIDPGATGTVYGPSGGSAFIYNSLNNMCQGTSAVWYDLYFFSHYGGKLLRWTGSSMVVVGITPSSTQVANLTQLIGQYLANLTNALLSAYTQALTNLTAALKAAYSVPIPKAPTYVGAFSITTIQTALNMLKSASAIAPPGTFPPVALPPAPLVVAPAASAAVAIAWAASRRDEDLTITAAVTGIALALFGVLMTLLYGTGGLSLVALGVIIAAAAAAWRRSD